MTGGIMSIEVAVSLIEQGDFEGALEHLWDLIDGGDEEARLQMAYLQDDLGLHYFSQDQYLYLIENEPNFAQEAARGAIQNYVWFREYESARELLAEFPALNGELGSFVQNSEDNFSTLNKGADFISSVVTDIFRDVEDVRAQFYSNLGIDIFRTKSNIDEWLMNIAIDLQNEPNSVLANLSLEVPIAGSVALQRPLKAIIGSAADRVRDHLKSCADAIGHLSNLPESGLPANQTFIEACASGKKAANKLIWLVYSADQNLEPGDSQLIQTVCWGLQRMGNIREGFAGFVLAGVTD